MGQDRWRETADAIRGLEEMQREMGRTARDMAHHSRPYVESCGYN